MAKRANTEDVVERRRKQFSKLPKGLGVNEIASKLKMTYHVARYWIKRLGYAADIRTWGADPVGEVPAAWEAKVAKLPKNLTVEEAAKRLKLSRTYTQQLLRRAGYESRPGYQNQKVTRGEWDKVDWSQQNGVIAKQMGVSRERVRQVREREGIAKAK